MVAYNFKSRFADLVEAGRKPHTIRDDKHNGRHAEPGDKLQLYTGMRTRNCRKLRDFICIATYPIDIDERREIVYLKTETEWLPLSVLQISELAISDGFNSPDEFFEFFRIRCDRILIQWQEVHWLKQLLKPDDKKVKPRSGAILGTMPIDKAKEIVSRCIEVGLFDNGISDSLRRPDWPIEFTLEELLIANRVVKEHPGDLNPDFSRSHMMHMADRGVAARYALANYQNNPHSLFESLGYTLEVDALSSKETEILEEKS